MSIESNKWLEEYEIKHPDIDYVKRDSFKAVESCEILRYEKNGQYWINKNSKKSLFGNRKATVFFTGDVTCFDKQFAAAQTEEGYSFDYEFAEIKPIFNKADLVVANLETAIVPEAPYRSEKIVIEENFYCNAPLEFLSAVRNAGVDIVTTANNHDIDTGTVGLGETIDNIESLGLIHTGTFKNDVRRYELFEINGIRIGLVAFATDHNALSCNLKLEGISKLLNNYSKSLATDIYDQMSEAGIDVAIAFMHWGKENKMEIHEEQYNIAKELASLGFDCIVGSHPHVLQNFKMLDTGSKRVPVYYSLGNFVSQNINNNKARSAIACLEIEGRKSNFKINCSYIPVYTAESYRGKKLVVLPIGKQPAGKKSKRMLEKIQAEIGPEISISNTLIPNDYIEDDIKGDKRRKAEVIDLASVQEYPIKYNDTHFNYLLFQDHAQLTGIDKDYHSISCTVPEEVLGLPVTEMSEGVFAENSHLKKVKAVSFPYVGRKMFKDCKSLEGYRMGLTASTVGEEAFANCINLQSAIMKKGVVKIESGAFAGCSNLLSVKLTNNVTDIADDAFDACNRVTFYCNTGSYAEEYAKQHGIKVVHMDVY